MNFAKFLRSLLSARRTHVGREMKLVQLHLQRWHQLHSKVDYGDVDEDHVGVDDDEADNDQSHDREDKRKCDCPDQGPG